MLTEIVIEILIVILRIIGGVLPYIITIFIALEIIRLIKRKNRPTYYRARTDTRTEYYRTKATGAGEYEPTSLLTPNEYHEYWKLKEITDKHNLQICPKVRLLDIVKPRQGSGYMSALGKIKSKHVDFVIVDQSLRIKGVLELDDSSHDRPDRIQRDIFVDNVLTSCGYTIIHTRSITRQTLDPILGPEPKEPEPYVRVNRTEPTFEEWKAAREAEQKDKSSQ